MTKLRTCIGIVGSCAAVLTSACSTGAPSPGSGASVVQVVAAENFWGSIATQLGGVHARVSSIIVNPNADPHSYEPTTADARSVARAQLVIVNGIGYDPWATRLVGADSPQPDTVVVGDVLHLTSGDNPHRWYNPSDVTRVVAAIVGAYKSLDPADAAYFTARQQQFESVSLAPYNALIAQIRSRYGGTKVGASESIFAMLAPALDLDLITPPTFLRAVSEGADVSAADVSAIDRQIEQHQVAIYVYNSQNVTPDVQAQLALAKAGHIPVATITETLSPATDNYEQWQTTQLQGIAAALARATGH